jgi:hypothetical protein
MRGVSKKQGEPRRSRSISRDDESCTNELFGTPKIQQPAESEDATDTQGDALETLSTEDLNQDPETEVRA